MKKNETVQAADEETAARRMIAAMRTVARAKGYEIIGTVKIRNSQTGNFYSVEGKSE